MFKIRECERWIVSKNYIKYICQNYFWSFLHSILETKISSHSINLKIEAPEGKLSYFLQLARYFLLVAGYFLLVAHCMLLFDHFLIAHRSLLVTFCSLTATFCLSLSARYTLHFTRCSLMTLLRSSLLKRFWKRFSLISFVIFLEIKVTFLG